MPDGADGVHGGGERVERRERTDAGRHPLLSPTRIAQFLSVGVVGGLVDNGLLVVLVEMGSIAPVVAAFGAKEASILLMFTLNERWTFVDDATSDWRERLRRLVRSNVVRFGGAIVGIATLYVLTTWFGVWYLAANVLGIGVGFSFNYTFESLVTWQVHDSN